MHYYRMRVAAPVIGRDTAALALSRPPRLLDDCCSLPAGVGVSTFWFSAGDIPSVKNSMGEIQRLRTLAGNPRMGWGEGKIQWLSLAICDRAGWGVLAHLILLTENSHRFRILLKIQ